MYFGELLLYGRQASSSVGVKINGVTMCISRDIILLYFILDFW